MAKPITPGEQRLLDRQKQNFRSRGGVNKPAGQTETSREYVDRVNRERKSSAANKEVVAEEVTQSLNESAQKVGSSVRFGTVRDSSGNFFVRKFVSPSALRAELRRGGYDPVATSVEGGTINAPPRPQQQEHLFSSGGPTHFEEGGKIFSEKSSSEGLTEPERKGVVSKDIQGEYEQKINEYRQRVGYNPKPFKSGAANLFNQIGYKSTAALGEILVSAKYGLQSAIYLGAKAVKSGTKDIRQELSSSTKEQVNSLPSSFNPKTTEGLSNLFLIASPLAIEATRLRIKDVSISEPRTSLQINEVRSRITPQEKVPRTPKPLEQNKAIFGFGKQESELIVTKQSALRSLFRKPPIKEEFFVQSKFAVSGEKNLLTKESAFDITGKTELLNGQGKVLNTEPLTARGVGFRYKGKSFTAVATPNDVFVSRVTKNNPLGKITFPIAEGNSFGQSFSIFEEKPLFSSKERFEQASISSPKVISKEGSVYTAGIKQKFTEYPEEFTKEFKVHYLAEKKAEVRLPPEKNGLQVEKYNVDFLLEKKGRKILSGVERNSDKSVLQTPSSGYYKGYEKLFDEKLYSEPGPKKVLEVNRAGFREIDLLFPEEQAKIKIQRKISGDKRSELRQMFSDLTGRNKEQSFSVGTRRSESVVIAKSKNVFAKSRLSIGGADFGEAVVLKSFVNEKPFINAPPRLNTRLERASSLFSALNIGSKGSNNLLGPQRTRTVINTRVSLYRETTPFQVPVYTSQTIVVPKTSIVTRQSSKIDNPLLTPPFGGVAPQPGFLPPFLPGSGFGAGTYKSPSPKKRVTQKTIYTPSLTAAAFGITSRKPPSVVTGLGINPGFSGARVRRKK